MAIIRGPLKSKSSRPEPVEQHRAGRNHTSPRQGIKRTSPKNAGEKARRRPRCCFGATHLVGELPRSNGQTTAWPSAPSRALRVRKGVNAGRPQPAVAIGPATSPSCGQQPLHRPGGPIRSSSIAPPKPINQNYAAPDSSAPTRQGIKTASAPAEKSGERARRRAPLSQLLRSGRGEADPVPESGAAAASNRKSLKRNRRRRRRRPHHRAASSRCTAQAARAGRATSPRQILRHPRAKG